MASVTVHCPRCQSAQVYRHGQNPKGHARFGDAANLLI
jgi:transposase-like protein